MVTSAAAAAANDVPPGIGCDLGPRKVLGFCWFALGMHVQVDSLCYCLFAVGGGPLHPPIPLDGVLALSFFLPSVREGEVREEEGGGER